MTQSTKELVRVFKAQGGQVAFIPTGISGECLEKKFYYKLYTQRIKYAFTESKEEFHRRRREQTGWSNRWNVPVDIAMARNLKLANEE